MMRREWSIRTMLIAMIAVATLPPIVIGLVQIGSAEDVGRGLLTSQLDRELGELETSVRARWGYREGALLLLAGNEIARSALSGAEPLAANDLAFLRELGARTDGVERAVLVGRSNVRVSLVGQDGGDPSDDDRATMLPSGVLPVVIPIADDTGYTLGQLNATVALTHLLPVEVRRPVNTPPLLAIFDSAGRFPLATPALPADLLREDSFAWADDQWLVRRRQLVRPPLSLVLAAPVGPFVTPFKRAAAQRTVVLLVGSVLALALATHLASRLTRSVQGLAVAADEIAQGNLGKRIAGNGTVETGGLARSFNAMASALEETLRQLAERASLAAVGEFAASLAHEIRNPLTAIRIDLQHLTRHSKPNAAEREALERAIRQVDRLERTVSGALELARGGQVRLIPTRLDPVVRDAIAAASPEATRCGTVVAYEPAAESAISALADAGALHQVLLNLILNAVQAAGAGGTVRIAASRVGDRVIVSIADDGPGIPGDQLSRIFDPFYTTRAGGSGLGLAVARRIVMSHGGELTIANVEPHGTVARVVLNGADAGSTLSMPPQQR